MVVPLLTVSWIDMNKNEKVLILIKPLGMGGEKISKYLLIVFL